MTTRDIRSKDNTHYKQIKRLVESSRERRASGLAVVDGVHLLTAFADAGGMPECIAVRDDALGEAEIAACVARFPKTELLRFDAKLFDALSPVETPTGVLGVLRVPAPAVRYGECAVLLENIQDPGNVGSIIRTAAAAGVEALFLSTGCADAWAPKTLRAGMGAHFVIDIFEQHDLADCAKNYANVLSTSLDAATSLYQLDLKVPTAFVFGNEGAGLSPQMKEAATHAITIPMLGKVESLNVAAAVAVCLFERVRQVAARRGAI